MIKPVALTNVVKKCPYNLFNTRSVHVSATAKQLAEYASKEAKTEVIDFWKALQKACELLGGKDGTVSLTIEASEKNPMATILRATFANKDGIMAKLVAKMSKNKTTVGGSINQHVGDQIVIGRLRGPLA